MMLRRTRPHQVPAPLIALDQSLREAPVDERREADTLARARETLMSMSIERLNTGRRWWPTLWFFYCPYCQEMGPDRVRRRRAVVDREAHRCTAGKP